MFPFIFNSWFKWWKLLANLSTYDKLIFSELFNLIVGFMSDNFEDQWEELKLLMFA